VRRYLAAAVALAAVLLGPALGSVLAAAPASAANGTSSVGCSTGDSCEVMLEKMILFGGANYDPGTDNMVIDITPPPCLWEPIGDTITGSQSIVSQYGNDPAKATTEFQVNDSVKQAVGFLKDPANAPTGTWYMLPVNPAASAAGKAECGQLPLFEWAAPGGALDGVNVPPATLAQLAVAKMDLPTAGDMTLNPASGQTFTNLPTYLSVALAGNYQPPAVPGGMPYTTVTATLGQNSATVWGVPSKLKVSATGGGQYTPATTDCGYLGSKQINTQAAQNAGPGTVPDCGATFQSPATWQLTATMTWQACWLPGLVDGPPPANCQPVPGAQLNGLNWTRAVTVNEIQSVDNGNG
jgi:hypothetical protein